MKRLIVYGLSLVVILVAGLAGLGFASWEPARQVQDRITAEVYDCPYPYDVSRNLWYLACDLGWDSSDPYLKVALLLEASFPAYDIIFFGRADQDLAIIADMKGDTSSGEARAFELAARLVLESLDVGQQFDVFMMVSVFEEGYKIDQLIYKHKSEVGWTLREYIDVARLFPKFYKWVGNPYAK